MSVTATIRQSSSVGGVSFPEGKSITGDGQIVHDISIPAAENTELTTRTDNTDGELTADDSDHIVATGDRIDLYWTGGKRRGATVGTVSATAIPFTGGDGDNLPSQGETVIACVAAELDVLVDGDNVDALLAYIAQLGQVVFATSVPAEIVAWNVGVGCVKMWHDEDGDTNPLVGADLARVFISHNDITAAAVARLAVVYNNVVG